VCIVFRSSADFSLLFLALLILSLWNHALDNSAALHRQRKSAIWHRGASFNSRPPSQVRPTWIRCGFRQYSRDQHCEALNKGGGVPFAPKQPGLVLTEDWQMVITPSQHPGRVSSFLIVATTHAIKTHSHAAESPNLHTLCAYNGHALMVGLLLHVPCKYYFCAGGCLRRAMSARMNFGTHVYPWKRRAG
jgi:hypothetical protein